MADKSADVNPAVDKESSTSSVPSVFRLDAALEAPDVKRQKLSVNWEQCLCHGYSSSVGALCWHVSAANVRSVPMAGAHAGEVV